MKLSQVAAQLFSIRDYTKTPADVAASMKKIRKIGYRAVQVSGMGPIPEAELKSILDNEGLICVVTHEPGNTILDEPQKIIDRLRKLDCTYTAYPFPAGISFDDEASVLDLARRLDKAGKAYHDAGVVLTYHNHCNEFRKVGNSVVLDLIYSNTDPRYLQGEPDTYWIQAGGASPAEWCTKLKGRLPLIHLKDYGIDKNNTPVMRELGNGNLDWHAIVSAAEKSGCKWFIVEHDGNWLNNDPFESLGVSFEYLKTKICK